MRVFEALATLVPLDNPAPVVTTLSPVRTRAGLGAITLTVSGHGFIGRSVVEWNGVARPTRFISSSKLEASIPGTDVVATGTALVRVTTPAPGGGTSSALTFTIDPPPTLTVSAPVVAPGDSVTVTLVDGFGGSTDWIALAATAAPDTSYLQWTSVGTGVTNRTWTVTMPTTAGTYEFRLFVNNAKGCNEPLRDRRSVDESGAGRHFVVARHGRRRRVPVHADGHRQQVRRLVGRAMERRQPADDVRVCHTTSGRDFRGRHRRAWHGASDGLHANAWRWHVVACGIRDRVSPVAGGERDERRHGRSGHRDADERSGRIGRLARSRADGRTEHQLPPVGLGWFR